MSALTTLDVGRYTLKGASLGGLYTAFHIPELDSLFDVGLPLRMGATARRLFLSHAHLDHLGALPALLGMRGMMGGGHKPLEVYCPQGVEDQLKESLSHLSALHRWPLEINTIPLEPDDEVELRKGLWVKALKTFHPVPSLGFLIFERIQKLKAELIGRPGTEIKALKERDAPIFEVIDRPQVAYLTDTLPEALKHAPQALEAQVLIIECTFLNQVKPIEVARAGCHIHIDELIPWASQIKSEHIVLMHFSQIHKPEEIRQICAERLTPLFGERLHLFLPPHHSNQWWL
jgi:ribonuclease Z